MKSISSYHYCYYYLFFTCIILYILYYSVEYSINAVEYMNTYNIKDDGFCMLYDPKYSLCEYIPDNYFKQNILNKLPTGYQFIDYSYKIKNTSLSTFHRDVTSSQKIYNTKYPIYTVIIYKYEGELLSLCSKSHKTYPFVTSPIINISGKSGTAFLFNCEILHAGCQNNCMKREIIQYKICHKDDLYKLNHLSGKHIVKEDVCKISFINNSIRKLSYYFELPINYIFYPLMIDRKNENTWIGKIQSYIPISFYNNI